MNCSQGMPDMAFCPNPIKQFELLAGMRLVWSQHVYWTRLLLISIAERLKDQSATTARLLQNPADTAKIFARYYPAGVASTIEQLLTVHLQIGAELITALRNGQTEQAQALTRRWYQNADQMADAFSGINPFFEREAMRSMLYTHLELTIKEVAARLAGNYPADIAAFDQVEREAMEMADYFSAGVMHQFPQRFV